MIAFSSGFRLDFMSAVDIERGSFGEAIKHQACVWLWWAIVRSAILLKARQRHVD